MDNSVAALQVSDISDFLSCSGERSCLVPCTAPAEPSLLWVSKGILHCVCDGRDLVLTSDQLMVFHPGQWHVLYAEAEDAPEFLTLSFSVESEDISGLYEKIFTLSPANRELMGLIYREQTLPDAYSMQMSCLLLSRLLVSLLQQPGFAIPPCTHENTIILRAQQYISANVRQKLSVPIAAKNAKVSPSYLTALFQKHLQLSPGEYIRRVKLQESKEMIREASMSFTEIASALQYSTIHHFSRQFKEKFGMTPSEYAKSVR